jgi:rod shape-determining protein MreC
VQRHRTARLAVLGSSVQRSTSAPYTSRSTSALRRRVFAGVLVFLSLAMITVYFRESSYGSLHDLQSAGASALRPFEVASERVARPFRDVYSYFDGLVTAKSENARLRAELLRLRQLDIQNRTALADNRQLRELLRYLEGPTFPADYRGVPTQVFGYSPGQFAHDILVAAGSSDGIRVDDPVATEDGLVGHVTRVASRTARVTLLTDERSAVSASDLRSPTHAVGILHVQGGSMILDQVPKDDVVSQGDEIVTAGSQPGDFASFYPKRIRIGRVTNVSQNDIEPFKLIQVEPYVDFSPGALGSVIVLVSKKPLSRVP